MTKKVVYSNTRKNSAKEFERAIADLWDLHAKLDAVLQHAESCADDIESKDSRKSIAASLTKVHNKLCEICSYSDDLSDNFGVCINNFVDVKHK